jgi:hypothetical protein
MLFRVVGWNFDGNTLLARHIAARAESIEQRRFAYEMTIPCRRCTRRGRH